jgi:hypothetical protein
VGHGDAPEQWHGDTELSASIARFAIANDLQLNY